MTETKINQSIEAVRNFLGGYQLCVDMLNLRRYERKRHKALDEVFDCPDLLTGDELRVGKILKADCHLVETKAMWEKADKKYREEPYYFIDWIE